MDFRHKSIFRVLVIGVLACACSSLETRTKYDKSVDFSKYRTYCWQAGATEELEGTIPVNEDLRRKLRVSIETQMSKRGFSQVDSAAAQLRLVAGGGLHDRDVRSSGERQGVGALHSFDPPAGDPDHEGLDSVSPYGGYRRGSFTLKMLDSSSGDVVWKGKVQGVINEDAAQDAEVKRFVSRLFARFPPK